MTMAAALPQQQLPVVFNASWPTPVPIIAMKINASWPAPPVHRRQNWDAVRAAIDAFALVPNCHVLLADASSELFSYQKGNVGIDTEMRLFSATKWISGVAVMALVEQGALGLDDRASQYLPYWTVDPADPRSRITLRHLLGFVSGFSGGGSCAGLDLPACTQRTYETANHNGAYCKFRLKWPLFEFCFLLKKRPFQSKFAIWSG